MVMNKPVKTQKPPRRWSEKSSNRVLASDLKTNHPPGGMSSFHSVSWSITYCHKKVWLWDEGNAGHSYKCLPLVLIMRLFSFLLPHEWPTPKLGFVHVTNIRQMRTACSSHVRPQRGTWWASLSWGKTKGGELGNKSRKTLCHDDGWCLPKRLNLTVEYIHLRVLCF